jgi:sterol desaturase/sphingolipid hydroxylase (fatty acid hydroxylase superfamily)
VQLWQGITQQGHDPVTYAIPAFFVLIVVEVLALRASARATTGGPAWRGYERRDTRASLLMGVGSSLIGTVWRAATLIFFTLLYDHVAPWHLRSDSWVTWVFVLLAVDLLWYAYHRFSHRVRVGWAAHQAHHSSGYFNLSTALRQKWNPWFEALFWLPLALLGVPPWMIYTAFSVNLLYQFWIHTERIERLPGWFEFVFNTPSHHRVHHGSDRLYLDRNYGGILIVWDRVFGTFQAEAHRPTYGLTKPVTFFNPVRLQYFEYAALARDVRAAKGWRARLGYALGPPGWQPQESAVSGAN